MSPTDELLRCFPCKKEWRPAEMDNPRRCPRCGGPVLSAAQLQAHKDQTLQSLATLRLRSSWIMRLTSLAMASVTLMNGYFQDRLAADFMTHLIMTTSSAGSILTELWAYTANRWWMLAASIAIQAAAVLFFFVGTAFLIDFVSPKLATLLAALPLAGALSAWHDFRGYTKILSRQRAVNR